MAARDPFSPGTKVGRLRRACLELIEAHRRTGTLPTSGRFLFYELVAAGTIPKSYDGARTPAQDVSDALTDLRESGLIGWGDVVDETRSMEEWSVGATIADVALDSIDGYRLDPWPSGAPLVMTESRSLAGVLRPTAYTYAVPIASTNGQSSGSLLAQEVGPYLGRLARPRVLYLGDLDRSGGDIEASTRARVEAFARCRVQWSRVAVTEQQVERFRLIAIPKPDKRFRGSQVFDAVETEALGQARVVGLLRTRLARMLPEPLEDVRVRERAERETLRALIEGAA